MPEISEPHATSHANGGTDEIDLSGLSGQQIWVPYNGKIADITHADTNLHTLALATALSETRTIIAVLVNALRVSGSGLLKAYPGEGSYFLVIDAQSINYVANLVVIAAGTNRLQYSLSTANDDFDVYCVGYVVAA